ncbi:transposase, partial [Achromatium sp. WMS2]
MAPLPFIETHIDALNMEIQAQLPGRKLTITQQIWLNMCLTGILLTNTVNWKAFERAGLGEYKAKAISWMFRYSKLLWDNLLKVSLSLVLRRLGVMEGTLVIDDTDHQRSKRTKRIWGTHKIFDKKTGGYFNGQSIVFLLLVTPKITIPVGFRFYRPDPARAEWEKEDARLKKAGIGKSQRPAEPLFNPKYPNKSQQALDLIREFRQQHSQITVKAVLADGLFASQEFMDEASDLCNNVQIISKLKKNQKILSRGREWTLTDYFDNHQAVTKQIVVRGGEKVELLVNSARLYVCAHGKKRFVIAMKFPNEKEYRFVVATELSWRTEDIIQIFTLRWLVEVFFEDWKLYEGWGQMAKQWDEDGSTRSLILSLLLDHALLLHPEQLARLENNLPMCTVGSLRQ